jgi:thiol-disulfide isomerase/thioredoxin
MSLFTTLSIATILSLAPIAPAQNGTGTPAATAAATPSQERPAAPATLSLGAMAPAFAVDTWVKGEPFEALETGKVHVLEFWATWCGPCIAAIPHLTELQKKYPDVRFVGVAASESGNDEAAKLAKVQSFVAEKGDTMGYRVVYVGDRAKMSRPWMDAFEQRGIPCTFIVDAKGRVAWIGHPMNMDTPLEQIVKGEFDVEKARSEFEAERAARAAQRTLMLELRKARETGDYGPAVDAIKTALEKNPTDALRMNAVQILAGPGKQPAEAWKIAEVLLTNGRDNPMAMNQLAWIIVDPNGGVAEPNLDIAMKAAVRACELTERGDGAILDTLARVHFAKGDVAEAVRVQREALEKTADGPMKVEMKATLEEYESSVKKG